MNVKKKISILLVAMIVIMNIFVGCAKENTNSNSSNGSKNVEDNKKDNSTNKDEKEDVKENKNNDVKDSNFNGTDLPIVNEKVTLKGLAKRRNDVSEFEGMAFFEMAEEATNVHIDWECIPQETYNEKKSIIFAGNELPDFFYGQYILSWNDIAKYSNEGFFLPLDDYMDKYSVNYMKYASVDPQILTGSMGSDGNHYALANFKYFLYGNSSPALYVNQSWLDKLNIPTPETTDDFYDMLKAFKDAGDINGNGEKDELPLTFRFANGVSGIGTMFGAFGNCVSQNYDFIINENDEVIYSPITDEYKEALKYFNKLYSEGLIDPEGFTQKAGVYNAKLRSDPSSVGAANFWNLNWAFGKTEDVDYKLLPPLVGPNGDQKWIFSSKGPYSLSGVSFAITVDCENPEIAFRWADYMYDEDVLVQSYNGMYGICVEKQDDGSIKQMHPKEAEETTPQMYAQTMSPGVNGIVVTTKDMLEKLEQIPEKYEKEEMNKFYANYDVQYTMPQMIYSVEDTKRISEINVDIKTYVQQMATKFISEGNIDTQWDSYLKKLNDMNLQEFIKINKDRYEEYKEALKK